MPPKEHTAKQTGSELESARPRARQAARGFKIRGRRNRGRIPRGRAEQAWDDAKDRVKTVQKDAEQYVRKNPTKAVFTALGIGFVLGLIFRR